jgi:hypothetical protein
VVETDEDVLSADPVSPVVTPTTINVTSPPREKVILPCRVYNQRNGTVLWRRKADQQLLAAGPYIYSYDALFYMEHREQDKFNEWNLLIYVVRSIDEDVYQCSLHSGKVEEVISEVTLTVTTVQIQGTEYVEVGDPFQVTCRVTGRPDPPESVNWFKDGMPFIPKVPRFHRNDYDSIVTGDLRVKSLVSQVMGVRSVKEDEGNYTCVSPVSGDSASMTVHVLTSSSKPVFIHHSQSSRDKDPDQQDDSGDNSRT